MLFRVVPLSTYREKHSLILTGCRAELRCRPALEMLRDDYLVIGGELSGIDRLEAEVNEGKCQVSFDSKGNVYRTIETQFPHPNLGCLAPSRNRHFQNRLYGFSERGRQKQGKTNNLKKKKMGQKVGAKKKANFGTDLGSNKPIISAVSVGLHLKNGPFCESVTLGCLKDSPGRNYRTPLNPDSVGHTMAEG